MKMEQRYPINISPVNLSFKDCSFEKGDKPFKDRLIARGIIFDGTDLIFCSISRDDEFACLTYIETSGGGVKKEETVEEAALREISEELGIKGEIVSKLGVVDDYYNLINRHNINHYFLIRKIGNTPLKREEYEKSFKMSEFRCKYEDIEKIYSSFKDDKFGKLIYQREKPMVELAQKVIASYGLM